MTEHHTILGGNAPTGTSETSAVRTEKAHSRTYGPDLSQVAARPFKTILDEEKLRIDREGQPRTAYSLRHTYICLRLMEGADIYSLDAVAINVMRPKKRSQKKSA